MIDWWDRALTRLVALPYWTLAGIVAGAAVVALAVGVALGGGDGAERPAAAASAPPVTALVPGAEDYAPAALRFAEAWAADSPDREQRIRATATRELADGLAGTTGPGLHVTDIPRARYLAEDSAVIVVRLSDGQEVAVLVVRDGTAVLAGDVRPAADEEHVE